MLIPVLKNNSIVSCVIIFGTLSFVRHNIHGLENAWTAVVQPETAKRWYHGAEKHWN